MPLLFIGCLGADAVSFNRGIMMPYSQAYGFFTVSKHIQRVCDESEYTYQTEALLLEYYHALLTYSYLTTAQLIGLLKLRYRYSTCNYLGPRFAILSGPGDLYHYSVNLMSYIDSKNLISILQGLPLLRFVYYHYQILLPWV